MCGAQLRDVEAEQTVQLADRENSNLGRRLKDCWAKARVRDGEYWAVGPGKGDEQRGQVGPPHRKPQGTVRPLELRAPYQVAPSRTWNNWVRSVLWEDQGYW